MQPIANAYRRSVATIIQRKKVENPMNPDVPFMIVLAVSVLVVAAGAKQYSKSPMSSLWMIGIGSFFAVMQLVLMMTN